MVENNNDMIVENLYIDGVIYDDMKMNSHLAK